MDYLGQPASESSSPAAAAPALLVTGAASGIGFAVATLAGQRGWHVIAADAAEQANGACAEQIVRAGGQARAIRCDVTDEQSVADLFGELSADGIVPAGVVAAAGVDRGGFAHDLPLGAWQQVLTVNLTGAFLICRAALAAMLAAGRGGSVVLCSSPAAFVGFAAGAASAYAASKGGVSALTRTLAVDYAHHGIRVNAIVPGPTETPLMWAAVPERERDAMRAKIAGEVPIGRLADPAEPAKAALWLLGDEASYVTGAHLVCDGGVLAKASVSV